MRIYAEGTDLSRYDDEAVCEDCGRDVPVEVRSELGFTETIPEDCPACGGRLEIA
jgi:DNA-directed RNA polymerase subunit RPC12/RpoP